MTEEAEERELVIQIQEDYEGRQAIENGLFTIERTA
jgi:hypothetical protein